jgi:hypothetical protein
MFKILPLLAAASALTTGVLAHPGVDHSAEIARRDAYFQTLEKKDLSHCAQHLAARGLDKKISARREAKIQTLRQKRGLRSMSIGPSLSSKRYGTDFAFRARYH